MATKKIIQQWGWRRANQIKAKIHDLNYFFWEATLKCNLNCRHCGSDCAKDGQLPELPAGKVIDVFENIAQNYNPGEIMVAVTGGEPLTRADLFDVLAKVNQLGFPWGMVTNGMLVNEKIVENCIHTGMKTVSVSLDGTEASHNWMRNNEQSYKKAMNALQLFVKSGELQTVEAITCAHSGNVDQLDQIYEILSAMGVQSWRIFSIFPKGRAGDNENLIVNRNLLMKVFDFIKEKRKSNAGLHLSYSDEGYLGCAWEKEVRDDFFYCGAGINIAGLLCDGTYSACPSLSRAWTQGNVHEISFAEAWETGYRNMRNRKWMKHGDCLKCSQWKNCQGSSLHLWDWEQGKTKICHLKMLNSQ